MLLFAALFALTGQWDESEAAAAAPNDHHRDDSFRYLRRVALDIEVGSVNAKVAAALSRRNMSYK